MVLLDSHICDFGWSAPDFDLATPGGDRHSLASLMGENGLLLAFICNHCPYVKAIIDRLVADASVLQAEGIGVAAIMPNDFFAYPADAPDKMVAFAETHGFTFPYLVDADQSVARAYGAVCTPDFFGFNAARELQYRGRLDDTKMQGDATNRTPELLAAMRQVAKTGHGPEAQEPAMGCSIKWKAA